jgi:hypothetical protein
MGAIKTDKEIPFGSDQIEDNINDLKEKLRKDTLPLYQQLYSKVNAISIQSLTWKDPLASRVISDQSEVVKQLPSNLKKAFKVDNHKFIEGSLRININITYFLY